jgi:hypothetical protein
MNESRIAGAAGEELENALHAYETAVRDTVLGRHARPEEELGDPQLHELRLHVIRLSEALPSACWLRPVCEHCRGRRDVDAVQVSYPERTDSPQVATVRRLCPRCWGTGQVIHLDADS